MDSDAAGAAQGPALPETAPLDAMARAAAGLAAPDFVCAVIEDAGRVAAASAATDRNAGSAAAAATSGRNAGNAADVLGSNAVALPAAEGSVSDKSGGNIGSNTPEVAYYCILAHGQLGPRHDPVQPCPSSLSVSFSELLPFQLCQIRTSMSATPRRSVFKAPSEPASCPVTGLHRQPGQRKVSARWRRSA